MKSKLLITSLSLTAASVIAQPSVPAVGISPPAIRAEMPHAVAPSLPQPTSAVPRPVAIMHGSAGSPLAIPSPGGSGGLLVGNGGNGGAKHADVNFEPTKPMVNSSSSGAPTTPVSYMAVPNLDSSGNAPTVSDSPKIIDGIVQ